MTDESEIITLKREDRIENEDNKETDERPEGPKVAFKRIVIGPFPPEFELMPDLVEHIMNQHDTDSLNSEPIIPPQPTPQQHKPHKHHSTPNSQSTNSSTPQDIKILMNKYYALLACLVVLVTAASVICMKLKNIHAQAVNMMNACDTSFQM